MFEKSLDHLIRSNVELAEFNLEQYDLELQTAIDENKAVIARQEDRIRLMKQILEEKSHSPPFDEIPSQQDKVKTARMGRADSSSDEEGEAGIPSNSKMEIKRQ